MKRVLVAGATGYLGRHVVRELKDELHRLRARADEFAKRMRELAKKDQHQLGLESSLVVACQPEPLLVLTVLRFGAAASLVV